MLFITPSILKKMAAMLISKLVDSQLHRRITYFSRIQWNDIFISPLASLISFPNSCLENTIVINLFQTSKYRYQSTPTKL